MPWLVQDQPDASASTTYASTSSDPNAALVTCPKRRGLLFVHVPRCGGTSLTKLFRVDKQCRHGRCCYYKIGLTYFFYRYRLLESANYPWKTWENLYGVVSLLTSTALFVAHLFVDYAAPEELSFVMWGLAGFTVVFSTFFATAPVMGRNTFCRRAYAIIVGTIMQGWTSSVPWLTGVNQKAWLLHLTAEKILRYGYVSREVFSNINTFAVVRNPYSRMVSVYMYNKMGPLEGFPSFVRDWYKRLQIYRERHVTDEWDIYCHALPQHEYTHEGTQQLVQCVIKQELLPSLNSEKPHPMFKHLPAEVRQALADMPHTNQRNAPKPWSDYYDRETQDLVLRMYRRDFIQFGYDTSIPKRADLGTPPLPPDEVMNAPPDSALTPCRVNLHAPPAERDLESNLIPLLIPPPPPEEQAQVVALMGSPYPSVMPPELSEPNVLVVLWYILSATVFSPFNCVFHSEARTLEDLHLSLALTLRRKALWQTLLGLAQAIVYALVARRMWEVCFEGNCQAASFFTIVVSFHFVMVLWGWIVLTEFSFITAVLAAVWASICFAFALLTWTLIFFRLPAERDEGYRVTLRIIILSVYGLMAIYYCSFAVFYSQCASAIHNVLRPAEGLVNSNNSAEEEDDESLQRSQALALNTAYLRWW